MVPLDALAGLCARFSYRADGRLDSWRILPARGVVQGDCDDFAITLAWIIADRRAARLAWHLITLRSVPWLVRTSWGDLHVALWHRGAGWACNIYPAWGPRGAEYRRLAPVPFPLVLFKLALGRVFG